MNMVLRSTRALALLGVLGWTIALADTRGGKIPITSSSEEAKKEFLQGRDLAERLKAQESIQYFEHAVAKDPNFAMAHYSLAGVATSAKMFFDELQKSVALAGKVSDGERALILALEAGVNGKSAKQSEYLLDLVKNYPNDERSHNALGNYYFGQQEYDRAVEEFKKATEINPDFSPAYNTLGYAYRTLEKYDLAEQAFKKYTELIPDDPNPYDSYAELLMKVGRHDESIQLYRKALSIDSHFSASCRGISANLMFQGKYDEALSELQKSYDMARNDGERRVALFSMAVLYVDQGKTDLALSEIDKEYAIAENIKDAANMSADLATKANILTEAGRPDEARALFEKSLQLIRQSNLSKAVKDLAELGHHYNMASVAIKKGDLAVARKEAETFRAGAEALRNSNQIRLAHQLAGMISLEAKDFDTALNDLKQSSQVVPYNLYRIALAYQGKGDKTMAKQFFMKAARDNTLPTLNYAFIRNKAEKMVSAL
jgi:tetratricopeptide (TPR) repeat protein